jgi:hypothetical protein
MVASTKQTNKKKEKYKWLFCNGIVWFFWVSFLFISLTETVFKYKGSPYCAHTLAFPVNFGKKKIEQ